MSRISTHVLDITLGEPARDVGLRLETKETQGNWRLLNSARTDDDGRCGQLLPTGDLAPGVYRIVFEIADYFATTKTDALYPVVEVTFRVRAGESQFHIPLLVSANGYTTYRGS